ncbi:MAG: VWA domain-containing protein [Limisphaerales bacterium]
MRALLHRLPKPLLFALLGGLGCAVGWLPGEFLLSVLRPPAKLAASSADLASAPAPLVVAKVAEPVPEPPPFNPQLTARLKREEAKTGDVQISLMWDNLSDLDLHCIGPDGERIFHNHRRSTSGGELDVDMNSRYTGRSEVVLVLDCSGSMTGRRMEETKSAAADLTQRLPHGMPLAVIGFHTTATNRLSFTNDTLTVVRFIESLRAQGGTRMDLGLVAAQEEFARADKRRGTTGTNTTNAPLRSVLLFTDGVPNKGTEDATVGAARQLRQAGVKVIAVGTGDARLDFLTSLTESTNQVFIATDGSLARAFSAAENLLKSPDWNRAQPARATSALRVEHTVMLALDAWAGPLLVTTNVVLRNNVRVPNAVRTNLHFLPPAARLFLPGVRLGFVGGGAPELVLPPPNDIGAFTNLLATNMTRVPDDGAAGQIMVETLRTAIAALTNSLGGWPATARATDTNAVAMGTVAYLLGRTLPVDAHGRFLAELERARRGGVNVLLLEAYNSGFLPQSFADASRGVINRAGLAPLPVPAGTGKFNPATTSGPNVSSLLRQLGERFATLEFAHLQGLRPSPSRISNEPVENIFWPKGQAPAGNYLVEVVHFGAHASPEPTSFFVGLMLNGQVHEFKGHIAPGQTNRVHEFKLRSAADLAREQQAKDAATRAERRTELVRVRTPAAAPERSQPGLGRNLIAVGAWTAATATGLAALLTLGQSVLLRSRWLATRRNWAVVAGALGAGLLSGTVSQGGFAMFASSASSLGAGATELLQFGQIIGWATLGALLGLGLAFAVPNLPGPRAALAGACGGVLGAIAFLALTGWVGETLGRLLGAVVLGAAIGLVVALVERLAREAALIVHWHENERTVINLGAEPVILGSSPEAHLYLPKHKGFPPITAIVTFCNGRVQMENKLSNSTHTLAGGNKLQIGDLWIEIQTDTK